MARFDVYSLKGKAPLVVDVQADILGGLSSRIVIPLLPSAELGAEAIPRLKPAVKLNGVEYRLITTDMSALAASQLGDHLGSLDDQRLVIIDAIDFAFQGF